VSELAGGQTSATFAAIPTALPLIESGRLRLLGVSTAKRSALVPDWPTLAESGLPGFDVSQWYGLVAPGATPRGIVDRLSRELANVLRTPEMREALTKRGIDPVASTADAFAGYVKAEIDKWAGVVQGLRE
jgi:tripartite-type tricarboxylate transporter receptor subunit TctC